MIRGLLAAVCAVLLPACAALAPVPAAPVTRPLRNDIVEFSLAGRVAVRKGAESYSAGIEWRHRPDGADRILLSSPLGQGLAELSADRSGARLQTADHQTYTAPDLEGLSEQVFGARLPLASMAHWALGQVWNSVEALVLDAQGRPASFSDGGWQVAYLSYESGGSDALPTSIRLRRDELDVRLKIDQWSLEP